MQQRGHIRYSHETHRLPYFIGLQRYLHFNSACILAYGQTSSGKTYTMKGEEDNFGLIPQTIREIFKKIRENEMVAKVSINYFEIYNENIFDLLSNENPPKIL